MKDENAFPQGSHSAGLSKRELFAAMALQGMLANPERYAYITAKMERGELTQDSASMKNARKAVYLADALLAALR